MRTAESASASHGTTHPLASPPPPRRHPNSADALPFRTAPHNIEAEQALLGAILVNNEAHDRVSGFLEPEHFFDPLHQQIYEVTAKLIALGQAGDAHHAQDLLRERRADRRRV